MPYKLTDDEVEAIVHDWPTSWREPVSAEEVSMEPPTDTPEYPVQEGHNTHDSDGESSNDTNLESQCILDECRTK